MRQQLAFLCVVGLGLSIPTLEDLDGSQHIWYEQPAVDWETGALPIGCGRMGASSMGGQATEVIFLNEDSIWSGGEQTEDRIPENGLVALEPVRRMLLAGNITEAGQRVLHDMTPQQPFERSFSYFAALNLIFRHGMSFPADYVRVLDVTQGNSSVSYSFNEVIYTREYLASRPDDIMIFRLTADQDGALSFNASFSRSENVLSNEASVNDEFGSITLSGSSGQPPSDKPILFTGSARFVAEGATITASGETLIVTNATTVEIYVDIETNYRYPKPEDLECELNHKLNRGMSLGFKEVKERAILDMTETLGRADIDFGDSPNGLAGLPTDLRVEIARQIGLRDVQLIQLLWRYGRYLLVSSSSDTDAEVDLPANLQGVWNNQTTAIFGGKFTDNINLEMNYWLATTTNLLETHSPLFDLMKLAQPRGQEMAKKLYGCNGTVFHHNLDLWGDPAPTDNVTSSTMWPMGAAWLVQHMMEQYRFTGDEEFLAYTAYPFIKDVAAFFHCYCFEWEGHLVTGPSLSPENSFIVPANMSIAGNVEAMDIAPEMDSQLLQDVMNGVVEAAEALGIPDTDPDVQAAKNFLPRIRSTQIGSQGQILEWRFGYEENEPGHRHHSALYHLFPSFPFSPLINQELSEAARKLLDRRVENGSGSTGWSRAWIACLYARLFSGKDVWTHLEAWFAKFPRVNLWNTDSGVHFQIDGNLGIAAALTEMIFQSHADVLHFLPALPDQLSTGSARGLLARGGFEVEELRWEDGKFKNATIISKLGKTLSLRVQDGEPLYVNGLPYLEPFRTEKGAKYVIGLSTPLCIHYMNGEGSGF